MLFLPGFVIALVHVNDGVTFEQRPEIHFGSLTGMVMEADHIGQPTFFFSSQLVIILQPFGCYFLSILLLIWGQRLTMQKSGFRTTNIVQQSRYM